VWRTALDGSGFVVRNVDRFDFLAVFQREEKLDCAVLGAMPADDRRRAHRVASRERLPKLSRQVGHRVEIGRRAGVDPAIELATPIGWKPELGGAGLKVSPGEPK
jgi:hypothetical protein